MACGPIVLPEDADRPEKAGPFAWKATYAEGFQAALRRGRPFIVYLPPVREADEHPVIRRLPQLAGVPPLVEGVRAGADEVLGLMERCRVKKVPAVVLLDLRENVVAGWEGGVPADLWTKLQAAVRRIDKKNEEDARVLAEARRLEATGNLEGAWKKAQPLLESSRTSPDLVKEARKIEDALILRLRAAALRLHAGEGLRPDDALEKDLEALRGSTSHTGFQAEVSRELARLKVTTIGAK